MYNFGQFKQLSDHITDKNQCIPKTADNNNGRKQIRKKMERKNEKFIKFNDYF